MKEGSLIVFEQHTKGYALTEKQASLFEQGSVWITPGTFGLICSLQEADGGMMMLAEVLIGNSVVFDIDLSTTEYCTLD